MADFAVSRPIPEAVAGPEPGLRGDVLRQRPDVRVAERQLAAATADIGVAAAAFYPRFTLSGTFGWQAIESGDLFTSATGTDALLGLVSLPLFAGGERRAALDAANARQTASLARYEQAVLLAIEESERALTDWSRSRRSRDELEQAARSSAEAADIARRLYDSGLADFLSVLDADRRRLEAEDALALRQTQVSVNLVAVYKALGAES